jgi:hypothetical protein
MKVFGVWVDGSEEAGKKYNKEMKWISHGYCHECVDNERERVGLPTKYR